MEKKAHVLLFAMAMLVIVFSFSAPCQAAGGKVIHWKFQDTYPVASWPAALLNVPMIEWIQKACEEKGIKPQFIAGCPPYGHRRPGYLKAHEIDNLPYMKKVKRTKG